MQVTWPSYGWELIFFPRSVSQTWCKRGVKSAKAGAEDFQVSDVKCLNHKTIAVTGVLQMFVLSLEFPLPLALLSVINRGFLFIFLLSLQLLQTFYDSVL